MSFQVGNRIRVTYPGESGGTTWSSFEGTEKVGVIIEDDNSSRPYRIRGEESGEMWGWFCDSQLVLADSSNKQTMTQKVGSMMKRLLDADTRKLVKAGLINGDLELTTEGQQALMAVLFEGNKAALVKEAEEIISEQEAQKD
jgi:hypothetical protein